MIRCFNFLESTQRQEIASNQAMMNLQDHSYYLTAASLTEISSSSMFSARIS